MKSISRWFLRLAVLYLLAGVAFGIYMAITKNFTFTPVHAHLNLLGWVSMALFAFFYRSWPAIAESTLAKVHFWLYVPAHFVQMVCLYIFLSGNTSIEPVLGFASILVAIAVICFAINVWNVSDGS